MEATATDNDVRAQRLENLKRLEEMGYAPYGSAYERTHNVPAWKEAFEEGLKVRLTGRLMTRRVMGKSSFAHVQESGERCQIYIQKNGVGEDAYAAFKVLDLGDVIGVEGECFVTKTGEPSVKVSNWTLLAKALQPPPDKWDGLQDVETRYRRRYIDLAANPETMDVFKKRTAIVAEVRDYLCGEGFLEVETPMLQAMAGGAAAQPFVTHYQALSTDMYLRIAPELYLKRLLVGGFDKVFELNRNFRNEGLDRSHNPEFTMLEMYQAYGDVQSMKQLAKALIQHAAERVMGALQVGTEAQPVDLSDAGWREAPYEDLIREKAGDDWFDLTEEQARERATSLGCDIDPAWGSVEITQEVFEKLIEKNLIQPTFVTRLPAQLVPLAKACEDRTDLVDVFELIIGGREIAPGYSELNDPLEQRRRFLEQAGGDASKLDDDFLLALEYGMPPAGGMGIGIDRLVMLLTGSESIRDVILFPQLKPRKEQ